MTTLRKGRHIITLEDISTAKVDYVLFAEWKDNEAVKKLVVVVQVYLKKTIYQVYGRNNAIVRVTEDPLDAVMYYNDL
jgi:hypothetical protein